MSSTLKNRGIIILLAQEPNIKDNNLNQSDQPASETPCQSNVDVFDSPYLSDFDALEFQDNYPELEHDEESLLQAEIKHNMAQRNTVILAKSLCAQCPIQKECFDWVMSAENDECLVYGVVAGYTQKERTKLRKHL